MFNRINVSTIILLVLILFGVLQVVSNTTAFLFLRANDVSIDDMGAISKERTMLNAARHDLLQAQYHVNNVIVQLAKSMEKPSTGGLDKATQYLANSSKNFQAFIEMPGLTTEWPELSDGLSKTFQAQQETVRQQITLLQEQETAPEILDAIVLMADEKDRARSEFNNIFSRYVQAAGAKYEQQYVEATSSYDAFVRLFIAAMLITLIIFMVVYRGIHRSLVQPLNKINDHFNLIENGDLRHYPEIKSQNEIGRLYTGLQKMQRGLTSTIISVRQGTESITLGSQEIAAGNTDLSSRTEEQAAALTQTAASMEQISATVQQNAENAREAMKMVKTAADIAKQGSSLMSAMVGKMSTINANAQQVGDIIQVIDSIAFQTNILALNAAVEAARAGEQGRGFAVVAGEVRSLAQRCAASAKEIGGLLASASTEISDGVRLANNAGDNMGQLASSVNNFASIMESITVASNEQSSGVEQIRVALSQMDQVTQQNAALVEEVATTASGVASQAVLLEGVVAVFLVGEAGGERVGYDNAGRITLARPAPVTASDEWESF